MEQSEPESRPFAAIFLLFVFRRRAGSESTSAANEQKKDGSKRPRFGGERAPTSHVMPRRAGEKSRTSSYDEVEKEVELLS